MQNGQLQMAYTFDATNMMTGAYNPAKGEATYTYNGFRNRVAKLENYHTEQIAALDPCREITYVLDMTRPYDNLLLTQSADSQSFVWGNSLLSASGKNTQDNFHYLQDHLGSPIRLANGDNLSQPISYDEFGVPEVTAGVSQPFGFTGYQSDNIGELWYAQARYYEPKLGRFGAEDIVRDGFNWYGYCNSNPIRYFDPLGLECEDNKMITPYEEFPADSVISPIFREFTSNLVEGGLQYGAEQGALHGGYHWALRFNPTNRGFGTRIMDLSAKTMGRIFAAAGVVRSVGSGVQENIRNETPAGRIVTDAVADTVVATGVAAGSAVGTRLLMDFVGAGVKKGGTIGTAAKPGVGTIIGIGVGAIVGTVMFGLTEYRIGNYSISEHVRNGVDAAVEAIGNVASTAVNGIRNLFRRS